MKFSKVMFAIAAGAFLTSAPVLASEAAASGGWREVAYSCDSGETLNVAFRPSGSAAQVTAADKPAVKLMGRPAKAGFRYSASRYELRGEGDAVTWQIGSKAPVKCTSSDAVAAQLAAAATR